MRETGEEKEAYMVKEHPGEELLGEELPWIFFSVLFGRSEGVL